METTSVIILNGFLGAGKTTLLKNLLIQAHEKQLSVSVIVNDMSELDVDGVLIANTDIVGKRLVRTVLIFTESSDQLSRATDRVPGLPASPGYVQ